MKIDENEFFEILNKEQSLPESMKLPNVQTVIGTIRKTMIDENGLTYETEEEIEMPGIEQGKND